MAVELADKIPSDVRDFVAQCRAKSYELGAKPNLKTEHPNEYGFRYTAPGLIYTDLSTEQNGRFSGYEYVTIVSTTPALKGQKFYMCQYAGADTAEAATVGDRIVAEAQHGLVIENPQVRFGSSSVYLQKFVGDTNFIYYERSEESE